jgi:hypothetical protein
MTMKRCAMWMVMIGLATLPLAGCVAEKGAHDHASHGSVKPQKLTIALQTQPTPVRVGQPATLVATVKAGEKHVDDAEVEFEVWQGDGPHETLKAKAAGEGAYQAEKTFAKAGTYSVTIHTTTRELHQMPTVQLEVKE